MTDEKMSPLRARMMEDMRIRGMGDKAQKSHIRAIKDIHVLPDGFHRIRHYGLLASGVRKANLATIRALLCVQPPDQADVQDTEPEITPLTLREPCPCCGGPMRIIDIFRRGQKPMSRAPPREQAA